MRSSADAVASPDFEQCLRADRPERESTAQDSSDTAATARSQRDDKPVKDVEADEPARDAAAVNAEVTPIETDAKPADTELSAIDLLMSGLLPGAAASEAPPSDASGRPNAGSAPQTSAPAGASAALDFSLASLIRLSAAPAPSAAATTSASLLALALPATGTAPVATDLPAAIMTAPPAPTPIVSTPVAPVALTHSMPAPDPGQWAEPLADRIVWLAAGAGEDAAGRGVREARIELHPAEWGSMQIRVELGADGRTKVSFNVETAQARAAIESSLPQLRDLLGTQSVHSAAPSFELSGGGSHQQRSATPISSRTERDSDDIDDTVPVTRLRSMSGLIDQFA